MVTVFVVLVIALWKFLTYPFEPLARFVCRKGRREARQKGIRVFANLFDCRICHLEVS